MTTPAQELTRQRANENYNNSPHKITDILPDKCWHGKRCFILGGGESLKGFNFSQLDKELTIGINKSFIYYDSSLLFFSDSCFYETMSTDEVLSPLWQKFKAPKVTTASHAPGWTYPDVYVTRNSHAIELPETFNDGINVWNNSGFGALVLAYLLGANPIYLLGYSMKCVRSTHWHCGYSGQTLEGQNARLHTFMTPFIMTAESFKRRGVHIVNLDPDSALPCYHKTLPSKVL